MSPWHLSPHVSPQNYRNVKENYKFNKSSESDAVLCYSTNTASFKDHIASELNLKKNDTY